MAAAAAAKEATKSEVQRQVTEFIVEPLCKAFDDLYEESQKKDGRLLTFQQHLQGIITWSAVTLALWVNRVLRSCNCFEELVTALFLSHIKLLSSIRNVKNEEPVKVTIPRNELFIHTVMITAGKEFYENPWTFRKKDRSEKLRVLSFAVNKVARDMLPMKDLLQQYLAAKPQPSPLPASPTKYAFCPQTTAAAPDGQDKKEEEEDHMQLGDLANDIGSPRNQDLLVQQPAEEPAAKAPPPSSPDAPASPDEQAWGYDVQHHQPDEDDNNNDEEEDNIKTIELLLNKGDSSKGFEHDNTTPPPPPSGDNAQEEDDDADDRSNNNSTTTEEVLLDDILMNHATMTAGPATALATVVEEDDQAMSFFDDAEY